MGVEPRFPEERKPYTQRTDAGYAGPLLALPLSS
jgi:hypothetical protein